MEPKRHFSPILCAGMSSPTLKDVQPIESTANIAIHLPASTNLSLLSAIKPNADSLQVARVPAWPCRPIAARPIYPWHPFGRTGMVTLEQQQSRVHCERGLSGASSASDDRLCVAASAWRWRRLRRRVSNHPGLDCFYTAANTGETVASNGLNRRIGLTSEKATRHECTGASRRAGIRVRAHARGQ